MIKDREPMSDHVAQQTGAEEITWDLSDLYQAVDDPAIERDLNKADERATGLGETYRGRIAGLDSEEMRDLLELFGGIQETVQKIGAYAYLHWSTNTEDPARGALLQKITERSSRLEQKLIFVELEWAHVPDNKAQEMIDDPV